MGYNQSQTVGLGGEGVHVRKSKEGEMEAQGVPLHTKQAGGQEGDVFKSWTVT